MKYLIFDTETNSVRNDRVALQLAWVLAEEDGSILSSKSYIILQEVEIDPYSEAVHGISKSTVHSKGVDKKLVYADFIADIEKSDCIVGHNLSFDMTTVDNDLQSLSMDNLLDKKQSFCTMNMSKDYVQAKDKKGNLKNPRLEETAGVLFYNDINKKFDGCHDALCDVNLTAKCFFELIRLEKEGKLVIKDEIKPAENTRTIRDSYRKPYEATYSESDIEISDIYNLKRFNPSTIFADRKVLITGNLDEINIFSREEGIKMIEKMGGLIQKTIVKTIDFVILGSDSGPNKIDKLRTMQHDGHGVICITPQTFKQLYDCRDEKAIDQIIKEKRELSIHNSAMDKFIKSIKKGMSEVRFTVEEFECLKKAGILSDDDIKK